MYPPNVQWEVTTECNHDCIHCYNYWRKDEEKIAGMSKVKTGAEYLEIAKKIADNKPVSVVITGGEPLLVFEKIIPSIEYLQSCGIIVSINTNAAKLTVEIAEYLKEKGITMFVSFPCSDSEVCDFITNTSGSKERIVEKLDMAYRIGVKFTNNIVVSKKNLGYIEESARFLKKRYEVKTVSITRVGKPINSDDSFDSYMLDKADLKKLQDISVSLTKEGIKVGTSCPYTPCSLYTKEAFELFAYEKLCTAGKTSYSIDTDGNIKACPRDSRLYGNVLTDNFSEIWERMHEWRDGTFIPEECKKCKVLFKCLGGCRTDAIPFTGKSNCLDLISNMDNIPIKFERESVLSSRKNNESDAFVVSKDLSVVKDGENYRITHARNYVFATQKLYKFLASHESFSFVDLKNFFESDDYEITNKAINKLVYNGIINKVI